MKKIFVKNLRLSLLILSLEFKETAYNNLYEISSFLEKRKEFAKLSINSYLKNILSGAFFSFSPQPHIDNLLAPPSIQLFQLIDTCFDNGNMSKLEVY